MTERDQSDSLGTPGWHRTAETGEPGIWVLHVEAGEFFADNALGFLQYVASERPPGPSRDIAERLVVALQGARQ